MKIGRLVGKFFVVLVLLICNLAWATSNQSKLTNLTVTSIDSKTRISFTLTGPITYKGFTLSNPNRIIIDLADTKLATTLSKVNLNNSPIVNIRQGNPKPHTLRLVLEINKKLPLHTEIQNHNLIIDLIDTNTSPNEVVATNIPQSKNTTPLQQVSSWAAESLPQENTSSVTTPTTEETLVNSPSPSTVTPEKIKPLPAILSTIEKPIGSDTTVKTTKSTQQPVTETTDTDNEASDVVNTTPSAPIASLSNLKGKRTIIVVVDPGHGGKDPGTMGSMGVREKDVVLGISKQVEDILNKQEGFHAVLTRTGDYFIPLRGRLNIARKDRGDIFVAIHADAYVNSYASGSSVFTLSAHGASSEAARWLAERENTSELGGVTLRDKSNVLRSVLIDLSQTATIASSMQSGKAVLRQLSKIGKLHRGFVEQAPFMVLKNPDIPSMLVETGFLSNPMEEQRLRDTYYQRKIAAAIVDGIKDYFYNNPPPGTLVASLRQNQKYS